MRVPEASNNVRFLAKDGLMQFFNIMYSRVYEVIVKTVGNHTAGGVVK